MTPATLVKRPALAATIADPLWRNSLFLMATSGFTALLGFCFWLVNSHFYSVGEIGLATTLLAAVSLLSYLSLFGTNNLVMRQPRKDELGPLISTTVVVVAAVSAVLAGCYAILAPVFAPRLAPALSGVLPVGTFVLLTVAASVNVLTDSAFINRRAAQYNLAINAFLQGASKLVLGVLLAGLGVFGILLSSGVAVGCCAVTSLLLLKFRLGLNLQWRPQWLSMRRGLRFSLGTYLSSVLNLSPVLIVPMIVLSLRGSDQVGFYNMTFQIASILHSLCYAVGESLFAEGAHGRDLLEIGRRAAGLMLAAVTAGAIGLWLIGPLLLRALGANYGAQGVGPLRVLAVGAFAVALNVWASFLLKAAGKVSTLIVSNVVLLAIIVGFTLWWADRGLVWVAAAWAVGNLASGLVAVAPILLQYRARRRQVGSDFSPKLSPVNDRNQP